MYTRTVSFRYNKNYEKFNRQCSVKYIRIDEEEEVKVIYIRLRAKKKRLSHYLRRSHSLTSVTLVNIKI